jgi:hypothetical protein
VAYLDLPGLLSGRVVASDAARAASLHATFTLVFVAIAAIRLSFLLPADLRANWIFRMTESDASRADTLRAVSRTLAAVGVFAPIGVTFPILLATFGPSALVATAIATLVSLLLAELVLSDWQRLPFTCTWLPGKRSLAQVVLLCFTAFVLFTTFGRGAVGIGLRGATPAIVVIALLAVANLVLQRRRRRLWSEIPLDFEDVSPYRVESMRLTTD